MLQLLLLGDCGGSPVSRGRAGGQRCLLQSQTAASFQESPEFACGCGAAELRAFPLLPQGPTEGDLPLPQVVLQAALHLQMLFLRLQRFRSCIYWRAQCGALAFPDHCFCCYSQTIVSRGSQF